MILVSAIKNTRCMQYLAAFTATLSMTSGYMYYTWSSPVLPQLTSSDSPIGTTFTQEEASWVASSTSLGCAAGGILSSYVLSKIGPKTVLLTSVLPMFLPWLAIIFGNTMLTFCIARFIAGVGVCIAATAVPIYIGEISDVNIRGALGTMLTLFGILGSLYVLSIGPFISYMALTISCSAFPIVFGCTFWFMPESPYYLVKINQKEKAYSNLTRLCAHSSDGKIVSAQLDEIEKTVEYDMKNRSTFLELLTNPDYRKPLFIMTGVKLLQSFSGASSIEAYMQTIIGMSKTNISPELSSVIFGVIQVPAVLLTTTLVDRVGRRPLFITSALGCALALSSEAIYFHLHNDTKFSYITDSVRWLPTTSLMVFLFMKSIGPCTLPYVLLGEIFPGNVKGNAISLFTSVGSILEFFVVKTFQPIATAWGIYTILSMYAFACILGSIFVFLVVPETKGKTFMEIQAIFNKARPV